MDFICCKLHILQNIHIANINRQFRMYLNTFGGFEKGDGSLSDSLDLIESRGIFIIGRQADFEVVIRASKPDTVCVGKAGGFYPISLKCKILISRVELNINAVRITR